MTHAAWPFPTSMPDKVPDNFKVNVDEFNKMTSAQRAQQCGVRFIHMHIPGRKGGCTVAYKPTTDTKNCKVLEISVTYTHPNDSYSKKQGIALAAERWLDGEVIMMPIRGKDVHETNYKLWKTFYHSVYDYQEGAW